MLSSKMDYVLKNGELAISTDSFSWIGGSPVGVDGSYAITGNCAEDGYYGTAMHSKDYDSATTDLASVLRKPHTVTISQGTEQTTPGEDYADATTPWESITTDFAVGDLLRPIQETVDGTVYSVWTNKVYSASGAGQKVGHMFIYPARIRALTGSGSSVTDMTLDVFDFYKIMGV